MSDPPKVLKTPSWPVAIRALRHPQFRVVWCGLVVSAVGTWMQIVALSLLVLKLSHGSAFALGCISLSQASAFFAFALIGGGIADRVNRKLLLLVTQISLMLLAVALGWLTTTNMISVPIVAFCAFLSGAVLSFDQPARAALIATLVPKDDLLNAISLQSAVFNGAAIAGPALAGLTINRIGLPANFFLNALSFTGMLLALLLLPAGPSVQPRRETLQDQICGGLRTVAGDPVLARLLLVYGVILFAGPSLPLLIPVLAAGTLHVGPATLGLLFSAAGLGAVAGAITLGSFPAGNEWVIRGSVACWCTALALTGISSTVPLIFCALMLLGASQSILGATTSTFLQTRVTAYQRGQAMSLNTLLLMGVRPLGDFPMGALIESVGALAAAVTSAVVVALTASFVFRKPHSGQTKN